MPCLVIWRRPAIIEHLAVEAFGGLKKLGPAGPRQLGTLASWGSDRGPSWDDGGQDGSHDAVDDDGEHGTSDATEQEGAEEDSLVLQEQDAPILAAEANREARAPIQKVRASTSRVITLWAARGDRKGAKGGKGKGRPSGKSWGKGGGCLICGSDWHFFRDCPLALQRWRQACWPKGKGKSSYWAEPVYAIYHFADGRTEMHGLIRARR